MIRVRFAPSPTGYLHVGGARTALFDWLFAKKNGGKFILRIEDTDTERSTKESEDSIVNDLKWCGLTWDEGPDVGGEYGPYRQSERVKKGIYQPYVDKLVSIQRAYYAIYDKEDTKKIVKKTFSLQEATLYKEKGHSVTVNFIVEEGKTLFHDLAKGKMEFDNSTFDDIVIIKSNGYPTYNFAVVVDDHLMNITHVVRGEDHLTNTPKQIMIYKALGWKLPVFMHIPLILGPDKSPLSKRHGGTSVGYFRNYGITSKAFINYLALLGWGRKEEIFDPFEKIKEFELEKISKKPSIFDYSKLEWINGQHLRKMPLDEVVEEFKKWALINAKESLSWLENEEYAQKVFEICRQKVNTLKVLHEFSYPFFCEEPPFEEKAREVLKNECAPKCLGVAKENLEKLDEWSIENIENKMREVAAREDIPKKKFFQVLRVALLGKTVTPGLFESIYVLGKARTIQRLSIVMKRI
ncbi:glutamate--tRNA ligase [Mesoaciditoga sp.]